MCVCVFANFYDPTASLKGFDLLAREFRFESTIAYTGGLMFIYGASCLGGVPIPIDRIGVFAFWLFSIILMAQFAGNLL